MITAVHVYSYFYTHILILAGKSYHPLWKLNVLILFLIFATFFLISMDALQPPFAGTPTHLCIFFNDFIHPTLCLSLHSALPVLQKAQTCCTTLFGMSTLMKKRTNSTAFTPSILFGTTCSLPVADVLLLYVVRGSPISLHHPTLLLPFHLSYFWESDQE